MRSLLHDWQFEYYMYGQFSKFVRTGAVRIDSEPLKILSGLDHVAFVNAPTARGAGNAGATVLVVVNTEFHTQAVQLRCAQAVSDVATLPARSVTTFRWHKSCDDE